MMDRFVYALQSMNEVETDAEKRKKSLYYAKVILTICIRDLVRQVSVHCVERGALMEKVLNTYLSIYESEMMGNIYDLDQV